MNISNTQTTHASQTGHSHAGQAGKTATGKGQQSFDLLFDFAVALGNPDDQPQTGVKAGGTINPDGTVGDPTVLNAAGVSTAKVKKAVAEQVIGNVDGPATASLDPNLPGEIAQNVAASQTTVAPTEAVDAGTKLGADVVPADPKTVPGKTELDPELLKLNAGRVATPQVSAANQPKADLKAWNIQELRQHMTAALETLEPVQQTALAGEAGAGKEPTETKPLDTGKLRQAGMKNLMKAANGPLAQPRQPAGLNVNLAQENATGLGEDPMANLTLIAHVAKEEIIPDDTPDTVSAPLTNLAANPVAASQPVTTDWSVQPVAAAGQGARTPTMTEQMQQVSDYLATRTDGAIRMGDKGVEANLRLYPPDLGQVHVEMTVTPERTAQAQFIVARPETAQLLQQHLQTLQDNLSHSGITLDRVQVSVQVRPTGGGQESGWRQGDSQSQSRREPSTFQQRQQRQQRGAGQGWKEFGE